MGSGQCALRRLGRPGDGAGEYLGIAGGIPSFWPTSTAPLGYKFQTVRSALRSHGLARGPHRRPRSGRLDRGPSGARLRNVSRDADVERGHRVVDGEARRRDDGAGLPSPSGR